MKILFTLYLLISFTILLVTGVLSFVLPFSLLITRMHIVFGLLTSVFVIVHFVQKKGLLFKQLKYVRSKQERSPLLTWIFGASLITILFSSIFNWWPTEKLVALSYEVRHRNEISRPSNFVASIKTKGVIHASRAFNNNKDKFLSIDLLFDDNITSVPSVAIWAETKSGTLIETLYISDELAYSGTPNWYNKTTNRFHILPIWHSKFSTMKGVDVSGNIDASTGASKNHIFSLEKYLPADSDDEYYLYIEVNQPEDPNIHWPDSFLGQPSILYSVYMDQQNKQQKYHLFELTGHSGDTKVGLINYDLSTITNAANIIELAIVNNQRQ